MDLFDSDAEMSILARPARKRSSATNPIGLCVDVRSKAKREAACKQSRSSEEQDLDEPTDLERGWRRKRKSSRETAGFPHHVSS
jgi:hypothetical protein